MEIEYIKKHYPDVELKINSEDKLDWIWISEKQKLSEEFIENFQDKVDWFYISHHQKLTEDFIEKFQDKVYWFGISLRQKLSEDFIEKFKYRQWIFLQAQVNLLNFIFKKEDDKNGNWIH